MATIRIDENEEYPSYFLDDEDADVELDVPDDVAARWRAARDAWNQAADEIGTAYRAIVYADQPRYQGPPPYPGRRI